ncbi:MAG: efflux RND transporter permease subunit [Desulfobacterales bacterium]|nr:efflux RND transporter permease subunit [Desulfobacterales bacterium]
MIVSDTAVRQRVSVMVLALIILVIGTYCYQSLPRESDPDITIPNVFVSTTYKGVSAADIETSITIHIEKKLKGLEGVKKISSISAQGLSSINIEFETDVNIDDALQKVRDRVDEAKNDLPADLEQDPSVFEVNFSERPIVIFSLSGTCGIVRLKEIADDLKDEIDTIPGVLEAVVTGGLEREILVEAFPEKLAYYNIPIFNLQQVVTSENRNTSGGVVRLGDGRYQIRVPGEFKSPDEIYTLVVGTHQGQPVYLKDVARVRDGFKEETSRSRLNGREAVNIMVKKRSGENIIAIADAVDDLLDRLEPTWPQGTEITKLMDKAKDIRRMVADLENNILSGLVLVVIVLFFALGIRNAVLVSMAIPFSMLLSFMVLYALGITLNMVVLFSLSLALGMLVDNAIVIVENIYRYLEQGVPRIQAAMRATSEVAYPVIGSTLTTLAAFSPMLFWPGIMGEFMGYLPLTLIVTLSSSLFVAMVINPALAAFFMRVKGGDGKNKGGLSGEEVARAGESPVTITGPILRFYVRLLKGALNHRLVVISSSFATLLLMFFVWQLTIGLEKPIEFFPNIEPKSMYVNIETPEGAGLDYVDRLVRETELAVIGVGHDHDYDVAYLPKEHKKKDGATFTGPSDLDNVEYIYAKAVIASGPGSRFDANAPNHVGIQFIDLEDRITPSSETLEEIRQRVKDIPGGKITVAEQAEGPPTGAPINIEIAGANFQVLGRLARSIRAIIGNVPFVEDIQDDFVEGTPTVRIRVDRQKAALFGLTTDNIGAALKTAYNGQDVSTFREGGEDYDITVQLPDRERRVIDVLRELLLPTPSGKLVPLSTLATVDYTGSIGDIVRIDHERVVTVKANVDETKVPGPVARAMAEELLREFPLPPGYRITFTGELEFQQESEDFLSKAFIIALFLIFLILVTQFNSISQPFIIMTSVILSLGGVFLGLTVIKSPFGIIMTGVGVISLAGVVVNNGIVLIDYTNKLRQRGLALREAVVAAGATRLRPVVLTAITTILGLIPMVTGVSFDFHQGTISWVSESSQWWRSMAIVVIFGLMIATFLTLVVTPTLYASFVEGGQRLNNFAARLQRLYWRPYEWLARESGDRGQGTEDG